MTNSLHEHIDDQALSNFLDSMDVPRVPQQARSRQKRDALLEAAARLFKEHGYDATTADDIAAAAGVSVGTFYSYFRNKRQLFLAIYATVLETVEALGIADINFGERPREAIRETVRRALTRNPLFYGLQGAWAELAPRDPDLIALNQQFTRSLYQQVLTAVRRVVAEGLAWPDLDAEETSWAVTVLLDQSWHLGHRTLSHELLDIERRQDALADLIFHAIFASTSA